MRGVGLEAHVTSRDPTLDKGRAPARSGVACPKKRATAIFDLSLRVGLGWEAHVTSRDPTLNAVGTRSCAIRRGMSKKCATAIFDLSLRVGRPRRPIRNCVPVTTPLCLRNGGPRNTRKDAKGDERCRPGGPCHIARPDIERGRDSCAIRRGMSKKCAMAIFDLSLRVGP